ncbi:hypothetical protein AB0H43_07260, partial [Hamadaea sp. NPDC050747]|uniref:hypothetical protein n=1 Tax=Hamadaea sp. NPDC050747 TaxID=3155789 RepID=UPI0033F614DD
MMQVDTLDRAVRHWQQHFHRVRRAEQNAVREGSRDSREHTVGKEIPNDGSASVQVINLGGGFHVYVPEEPPPCLAAQLRRSQEAFAYGIAAPEDPSSEGWWNLRSSRHPPTVAVGVLRSQRLWITACGWIRVLGRILGQDSNRNPVAAPHRAAG